MNLRTHIIVQTDPAPLLNAVQAAKANALTAAAHATAATARALIRLRNRASRPGEPPSDRRGFLRRGIRAAWDESTESAVAGPIATNPTFPQGDGLPLSQPTVPAVLEHGGLVQIRRVRIRKRWRNDNNTLRDRLPQLPRQSRVVQIAPRPYMRPALTREAQRFPELFRASLRK